MAVGFREMRDEARYLVERKRMVEEQVAARGLHDARLLEAMRSVPRHCFVPPEYNHLAYADGPLPIGCGQTISQPYIVALMTNLFESHRGGESSGDRHRLRLPGGNPCPSSAPGV